MMHALSMKNPKKIPIMKPVAYSTEFVFFILIFNLDASGCLAAA